MVRKLCRVAGAASSIIAAGASAQEVSLSWSDNSDNEDGFHVERSTDGGAFELIGSTGADVNTYLDTSVEYGVNYDYRVNAFNEFGVSGYTNNVTYFEEAQVNLAPSIGSLADISIEEERAIAPIDFMVGDAETDAALLTVSATSSNAALIDASGMALGGSGSSRTLSLTPETGATGTATITVRVSDGELEASSSFVLAVTARVNAAPTLSALSDGSTAYESVYGPISFTVGDEYTPSDHLIVTAVSSDQSVVADSGVSPGGSGSNRSLTITPNSGSSGITTITVSVSDGGLATSGSFALRVQERVNEAPSLSSISDQTTKKDVVLGPIAFSIGDEFTPAGDLVATGVSSDQSVVSDAGIALSGSGADRSVSISPVAGASGLAVITLSVSDGSLSSSASFTVTVQEPSVVEAPSALPAAGAYVMPQSVTLSTETPDTKIYYTVDGTDPSVSSQLYSGAIALSEDTVLRSIAIDNAGESIDSEISKMAYDFGSWSISTDEWLNIAMPQRSGSFRVAFEFVPNGDNIDPVIGLSEGDSSWYDTLPVTIRFNAEGLIDARSGDSYGFDRAVAYTAGVRYRFLLDIDTNAQTYSVHVAEGSEGFASLISGATFRTGAEFVDGLDTIVLRDSKGVGGTLDRYYDSTIATLPSLTIESIDAADTVELHGEESFDVTISLSDERMVESVAYFLDGVLYAESAASPFAVSMVAPQAGYYELVAEARMVASSRTVQASQKVLIADPLTDPAVVETLRRVDIDQSSATGSTEYAKSTDSLLSLSMGGSIGGTSDSNHYAYLWAEGDVALSVRLKSLNSSSVSGASGIMLRRALYGRSEQVSILRDAEGKLVARVRGAHGAIASEETLVGPGSGLSYLRLSSTGGTITLSASIDGSTWQKFGEESLSLGTNYFVGLALAGGESPDGAEAVYDSLRFEGALGSYTSDSVAPAAPHSLSISSSE